MRIQLRLIIKCNIIISFQLMQMLFHQSTGLLYLIIVRIKNTFVLGVSCSGASCSMEKMSANCSHKNLKCIPQDLNVTLEILDASYNPIIGIGQEDFERYSNLVELRLIGLTNVKNIESDMFAPLKKLKKLEIRESVFRSINPFFWPESLKSLDIGANPLIDFHIRFLSLNLTNLRQLEDLNASLNRVEDFPLFHPEAPVGWIDLYNNPLKNITAEHLAPYCLLKILRIRVTGDGTLNTKPYFCQCRRLEKWMNMFKIAGFDLSCYSTIGGSGCEEITFSKEMMDERQACLDRQPKSSYWIYMIIIALLSLCFPACYLIFEVYKRNKQKTAEDVQDNPGGVASESDTPAPETNDTPAPETVDVLEPDSDQ